MQLNKRLMNVVSKLMEHMLVPDYERLFSAMLAFRRSDLSPIRSPKFYHTSNNNTVYIIKINFLV